MSPELRSKTIIHSHYMPVCLFSGLWKFVIQKFKTMSESIQVIEK